MDRPWHSGHILVAAAYFRHVFNAVEGQHIFVSGLFRNYTHIQATPAWSVDPVLQPDLNLAVRFKSHLLNKLGNL